MGGNTKLFSIKLSCRFPMVDKINKNKKKALKIIAYNFFFVSLNRNIPHYGYFF